MRGDACPRQVELRNDSVVKGQLDAADEGMNLMLSAASWQPLQGDVQAMDFLFIKGSHVRCACALPGIFREKQCFPPGLAAAARRRLQGRASC